MSLEKKSETDVALESKTRFDGFHNNAPHALDFTNKRIDNEIDERENGDDDLNEKITALTNTHNQDIQELRNEISTQIAGVNSQITALEQRVAKLEGGAA